VCLLASGIVDLEKAYADVEEKLAVAQERLQEALEEVDRLRAEAYGLQLALARHGDDPDGAKLVAMRAQGVVMSRSSAVQQLLLEAQQPLSPSEISERLVQYRPPGTVDTPKDVGAALAYLKRTQQAVTVGRGQWIAVGRVVDLGFSLEGSSGTS
jgi:hypothetical protein